MSSRRIALLREHLRHQGIDAFVVSSLSNIRYLTGFSGSHGLCVIGKRDALFITDSRYALQARREVRSCRRIVTRGDIYEAPGRHTILRGCRFVGFEADVLTYGQYRLIRRNATGVSWIPLREVVERIALVKDKNEVECVRAAVRISDRVFDDILTLLRPGVSELDIAAEISYAHRKYGAQKDAFEPIVASGERSALPHAQPSRRKMKRRDLVLLDFGCVVDGYSSDVTRTIVVGAASSQSRHMYDIVLRAQRAAIDAAHGGMAASDLDAVARNCIAREGFGKYFIHSLGHGLGLCVHEPPRISAMSKEVLREGSVITIEPGVYLPGFGGVRIEDDVLLTEGGCEVLNRAPKQFMIV